MLPPPRPMYQIRLEQINAVSRAESCCRAHRARDTQQISWTTPQCQLRRVLSACLPTVVEKQFPATTESYVAAHLLLRVSLWLCFLQMWRPRGVCLIGSCRKNGRLGVRSASRRNPQIRQRITWQLPKVRHMHQKGISPKLSLVDATGGFLGDESAYRTPTHPPSPAVS